MVTDIHDGTTMPDPDPRRGWWPTPPKPRARNDTDRNDPAPRRRALAAALMAHAYSLRLAWTSSQELGAPFPPHIREQIDDLERWAELLKEGATVWPEEATRHNGDQPDEAEVAGPDQ